MDNEITQLSARLIAHGWLPRTDAQVRRALIDELSKVGRCEVVQIIGKMALVYRKNPKANKNLSNIHRYQA